MNTGTVTNLEASLLTSALVAFTAQEMNMDSLIIKGPAAVQLGIRPPRPSADVDVLVRPAEAERLSHRLLELGWVARPHDASDVFPVHSVTYYHPSWSCDIDLHVRFPGFEAPANEVFSVLWKERIFYDFAGFRASVPGTVGATIIQALHCLRAPWLTQAQLDYDFLVGLNGPAKFSDVIEMALETQSLGSLQCFFSDVYSEAQGISFPEPSKEWKLRRTFEFPGLTRFLAFRNAPWRLKYQLLATSIFPTRNQLASNDLTLLNESSSVIFWRRMRRLFVFFGKFPQTLFGIWKSKSK